MVDIIRFRKDPHEHTLALLPWYVNGTLEADEAASVEAHLSECPECRAELDAERALTAGIADMPPETDRVWQTLRGQIEAAPRRAPAGRLLRRPVSLGWALAAQAASLAVIAVVLLLATAAPRAPYRALSAPAAQPAGNVLVIFQPTTSEKELRGALLQSGARLVGGPTASDAYVLHVAPDARETALRRLRSDEHVVLAEPIDGALEP